MLPIMTLLIFDYSKHYLNEMSYQNEFELKMVISKTDGQILNRNRLKT
jgi:hypothetical protein